MAKAAKKSILDMIKRHAELYREMDRLYEIGGDDQAASWEAMDLENRIVATRATAPADVRAKWSFMRETHFITDRKTGRETGCLYALVEMILQMDVEATGEGIPELDAMGITAEPRDQRGGERIAAAVGI